MFACSGFFRILSTCLEIWIWNLVCTSSRRRHRFSAHTYIVSVLNPSDFRHGLSLFGSVADRTLGRGSLAGLPASEMFSGRFVHVLRYQFETWYIRLIASATYRVGVSTQFGHFDLFYSQKWVKVIFLNIWLQKLYRDFRFGTHKQSMYWYSSWLGNIWPSGDHK